MGGGTKACQTGRAGATVSCRSLTATAATEKQREIRARDKGKEKTREDPEEGDATFLLIAGEE